MVARFLQPPPFFNSLTARPLLRQASSPLFLTCYDSSASTPLNTVAIVFELVAPLLRHSQGCQTTKLNSLGDEIVIVTGATSVRPSICFWDTPSRSLKRKPLNFSTLIPTLHLMKAELQRTNSINFSIWAELWAAVISPNGSAINCPDKAQQYYHNEFVYLICRYRLSNI